MLFRKFHLSISISTIVLMASLSAPGTAAAEDAQKKWGPHVDLEGKWGTERSLGEVDLFMPLAQNADSLLFTDLRMRLDDHSSREGNFGLGFRKQMSNDWIAGIYGFYDIRRTPNDNTFHQATFGVEALTENNELRLNAYIPEEGHKEIPGSGGGGTTAVATGGQFQIISEGISQEAALAGFDIEAGQRFDLTPNWTLWAYAGGFHFDKSGYDNVTGPRGRLEFSRENLPYMDKDARLTLGVESQYDDVRKGQSFAIARLRVPLSSSTADSRSALDKRMTDRITRDVDIVAGVEEGEKTVETAELLGENGVDYTDYTLVDANTADVPSAVNAAGPNSLVILDGSAGKIIYVEDIEMDNDGQVLSGGGRTVTLTGAETGTTVSTTLPGTRPTISTTTGWGNIISITGDNTVLTGINVEDGGNGIDVTGDVVTGLNVTINDTSIINDTTAGALNIYYATVTMNNVYIDDRAHGVDIRYDATLNMNNSTIENVDYGVTTVDADVTMNNSTLNNITADGIFEGGGNNTLSGSGNTMTAIGGDDCNTGAGTTGNLAYTLDGVPATCP